MSNARDKANIPALNFSSTGIDDNATSTAITIQSDGDIGIGTTNPAFITGKGLEIQNSGTATLRLQDDGVHGFEIRASSTEAEFVSANAKPFTFDTGGSERMRINSDGKVLIGTTSEPQNFGTDRKSLTIKSSSSGNYAVLQISGNATSNDQIQGIVNFYNDTTSVSRIDSVRASSASDANLRFFTAPSSGGIAERMRIDSSGNVGIGETAPLGKLHIKSADSGGTPNSQYDELVLEQNGNNCGMTILCNSPGDGAIYFGDSADNDIGGIAYSHFDNKMFFKVNGSERMRIDSSGRLLFGTTSTFAGGSTLMNIALNTTNSTSSPFPNGIVFVKQNFQGSNAVALDFEDFAGNRKGSIQFNEGGTSFNTSSDYRLKENVNYDFDATTRLKQLRPARFNFIADADTTVDGFIAHEVQSIVPEAISGTHNEVEVWKEGEELPEGVSVGDNKLDGEGNTIPVYQGIDQSKLVPLLVKTIQELEARITQLENA